MPRPARRLTCCSGLRQRHHSGRGGDNTVLYDRGIDIGADVINDSSTAGHLIQFSNLAPGFGPLARLTDTPSGARLELGDGDCILFLGRLATDLGASDFVLI